MMPKYLINLQSKNALNSNLVGGKAAGLARLRRSGFRTPSAFIITTKVFPKLFPQIHQDLTKHSEKNPLQFLNEIQGTAIPQWLTEQINSARKNLPGSLIVRSSLTEEDNQRCSFAGQLDSFIEIESEYALFEAIKRCYASMFHQRFQIYLTEVTRRNPDTWYPKLRPAILVQQMLPAKVTGVAFSADPITGRPCVIVEALRSSSEEFVTNPVAPDRYTVNDLNQIEKVRIDPEQPAILDEKQIVELAGLVRKIAAKLGCPQDTEWIWDGGNFYFLQSRPITSLATHKHYSYSLVPGFSPGFIQPLSWSINFQKLMDKLLNRILCKIFRQTDFDFTNLLKKINSRFYLNQTLLAEIFSHAGLPANFWDSRPEPMLLKINFRLLWTLFRLIPIQFKSSGRKQIEKKLAKCQSQTSEKWLNQDWTKIQNSEILKILEKVVENYSEIQWCGLLAGAQIKIRNRLLSQFFKNIKQEIKPADLLTDFWDFRSVEPADFIYSFFDKAGMKNSTSILKTKDELISDAPGRIKNITTLRRLTRYRVAARLKRIPKFLFYRLLNSTVRFHESEEKARFLLTRQALLLENIFRTIASNFQREGILFEPDDFVYLSRDEIRKIIHGQLSQIEVRTAIENRKVELTEDAQKKQSKFLIQNHTRPQYAVKNNNAEFLSGDTSSAGVVTGLARVVNDPAEITSSLTRKDILVVPDLDNSWTPFFPEIGGVISESGELLSHAAIVAREYELPAVSGIKNACHLIQNGQSLTLDATHGRIYLAHVQMFEIKFE